MVAQKKRLWSGFGWAMVYAAGLLWICAVIPNWGRWYFAGPYHREESAAMLGGGLALSHDPADLAFDLCWAQGGVQQVWGLGIPLWRLPFDAVARSLGQAAFPDGLLMAAALAVAAWLVGRIFYSPEAKTRPLANLGGVLILLFFPPFLSLLSAGISIHTEVLVYVYLYGVGLACGLAALTRRPTWGRFWLLCSLAGVGGLVRPTLVFYGAATVLAASWVMRAPEKAEQGNPWRIRWAAGGALFVLGGMILWWTNYVRFGDGFEFGHRLNLQSDLMRGVVSYSTRFDYPYQDESLARAGRELWGALFQVQQLGFPTGPGEVFFPGQSPVPRYREFLSTTFDGWMAILVLAGWVAGAMARRKKPISAGPALAVWSFLATAPLAAFYVRAPFLTDRYMMDFAPAFAVAVLVFWRWLAEWVAPRRGRAGSLVLFAALCSWLAWEMVQIRSAPNVHSLTWQEVAQPPKAKEASPHRGKILPASYKIGDRLSDWGIPFNGTGWDARNGTVAACVTLFVTDPEFLELDLVAAPGASPGQAQAEAVRAKVGLDLLRRISTERIEGGWRVRFAGPAEARYRKGLQTVFIATVAREHLFDERTPWVLRRVAWR